jgi:hypothetical protein
MEALPIVYSAAIFFALILGGLATLRRPPNVVVRAVCFVLLCFVCFRLTLWLALQWRLDAVGAGAAWAAALVLIVAVEAIRVWRNKRGHAL